MSARPRNWRLEAVAWLAALALVVGALAFSGSSKDTTEQTQPQPEPRPALTVPAVQP